MEQKKGGDEGRDEDLQIARCFSPIEGLLTGQWSGYTPPGSLGHRLKKTQTSIKVLWTLGDIKSKICAAWLLP